MRYALLVCYDGTHLSGYQRQKKGERTVQGELERAAGEVFGTPTRVTASGRTDAGVHALGQVCHLDGETSVPPEKLSICLNAFLPPDIKVYKSIEAPWGFDCTRPLGKTYRYAFYTGECEIPLLSRYAAFVRGEVDIAAMREGARLLTGEHDFAAFCASGSSAKTTVRMLYSVEIEREDGLVPRYFITVTGNGFLYNMVRILAGELVAIGQGKGTDALTRALASGERSLLAKTMPPRGLTLLHVDYGCALFGQEN